MGTNDDNGQPRRPTSPFDHLVSYDIVSSGQFGLSYRNTGSRDETSSSTYDFQDFQGYGGISQHVTDDHLGAVAAVLEGNSDHMNVARRGNLDSDAGIERLPRSLDASSLSTGTTYTLQLNNLMDYSVQGDGGEFDQLPDIDPSDVLPDFGVIQSSSVSDSLAEPTMGIPVSPSRDMGRSDQSHFSMKSQESSSSRHEILSSGGNLINFTDDGSFGYTVSSLEEPPAGVINLAEGGLCMSLHEGDTIPVSLEDFMSPSSFAVASTSNNETHPVLPSVTETVKFTKLLGAPESRVPSTNDLTVVTCQAQPCGIVTPVIQAVSSLKKHDVSLKPGKSEKFSGHESSLAGHQTSKKTGQLYQCAMTQSNAGTSVKKTQVASSAPSLQSSTLNTSSASSHVYSTASNSSHSSFVPPNLGSGMTKDSSPKAIHLSKATLPSQNCSTLPNSNPTAVKNKSLPPDNPHILVNASHPQNVVLNRLPESNIHLHYKTTKSHDFTKPSSFDSKSIPDSSDKNSKNGFQSSPHKASLAKNAGQNLGKMNLRSASLSPNVSFPTNFIVHQNQTAPSSAKLETQSHTSANANINSIYHDGRHLQTGAEKMKDVSSVNKSSPKGLDGRQLMEFSSSPASPILNFQQSPVAVSSSSPLAVSSHVAADLRETLSSSPALSHQNNEINLLADTDEILPNIQFSTSLEDEFGDPQSILADNLEEVATGSLQDLQGLSSSLAAPDIFTANGIRTSFIRNHSTTQNLPHCTSSSLTLTFPSAFLDNSNMSIDISNLSDDDISVSNSNLIEDFDKTCSPRKSSLLHSDLSFSQMLSAIDKKEDEASKPNVNIAKIPTVISQDANLSTSSHGEDNQNTTLKQAHKIKEESNSSIQPPARINTTVVKRTKDPHQSSEMLVHQVYYRCRICMGLSPDENVIVAHIKNDHPDNRCGVGEPDLDDITRKPEKMIVFLPRTSTNKSSLKNLPKYSFPGVSSSSTAVSNSTHSDISENLCAGLTLIQSKPELDTKTREVNSVTPKILIQPLRTNSNVQTLRGTTVVQSSNKNSHIQTPKLVTPILTSSVHSDVAKKFAAPLVVSKTPVTSIQATKMNTHKVDTSVIKSSSSVGFIQVPASTALKAENKAKTLPVTVSSSVKDQDENSETKVKPESSVRFDRGHEIKSQSVQDSEESNSQPTDTLSVTPSTDIVKRERKYSSKSGRPFAAKSIGLAKVRKGNRKTDESDEKLFGIRCNIGGCGLRLSTVEKVNYHRRCHPQVSQSSNDEDAQAVKVGLKCPECPVVAQQWRLLATHLWRAHCIDIDLHKCPQCEFRCYSASRLLKSHMPRHSDVRPYLCETCGSVFKTYKLLGAHRASLHSTVPREAQERFTCELCNKNFSDKRMLLSHINVLHKKVRPHLCFYCGKTFGSKNTLVIHLRTHTGEKPFACEHCSYRTSDHNSLRRHKMQHSKDKRYKCSLCPYSCIQSTTYKVHLAEKHFQQAVDMGLLFACEHCKFKTVKRDMYRSHLANQHQITLPPDPPPDPNSVDTYRPFSKSTSTTIATSTRQQTTTIVVSGSNAVQESKTGIATLLNTSATKAEPSSDAPINGRQGAVEKSNSGLEVATLGVDQKSSPIDIASSTRRRTIVMDDVEFKRINSMDTEVGSISNLKVRGVPQNLIAMTTVPKSSGVHAPHRVQQNSEAKDQKNKRKKYEQNTIAAFETVQNNVVLKPTNFLNVVLPSKHDSDSQVTHEEQGKTTQQITFPSRSVANLGLQNTGVYVQNLTTHVMGPDSISNTHDQNSIETTQVLNSTSGVLSQGTEAADKTGTPLIIGRIEVDSSGNLVLISDGNFEKANLNGTAVVFPPNLVPLVAKPKVVESNSDSLKQTVVGPNGVKINQVTATTTRFNQATNNLGSNSVNDRASVLKIGTLPLPMSDVRPVNVTPNKILSNTISESVLVQPNTAILTSATVGKSETDSAIVLSARGRRTTRKPISTNTDQTRLLASPSAASVSPREIKTINSLFQGNVLPRTKQNVTLGSIDDNAGATVLKTPNKSSSESGKTSITAKKYTVTAGEFAPLSAKLEPSPDNRPNSKIVYSIIPGLQQPQRTQATQLLAPQSGLNVAQPQKIVLQQIPQYSLLEKTILTSAQQPQQQQMSSSNVPLSHNSPLHQESYPTFQPQLQFRVAQEQGQQSQTVLQQQPHTVLLQQPTTLLPQEQLQVVVRPAFLQHKQLRPLHIEQPKQQRLVQPVIDMSSPRKLPQPVIQIRLQQPGQQLVQRLQLPQVQEVVLSEPREWNTVSYSTGSTTIQQAVTSATGNNVTRTLTSSSNGVISGTTPMISNVVSQGLLGSFSGQTMSVPSMSVSVAKSEGGAISLPESRGNGDEKASEVGGSLKNRVGESTNENSLKKSSVRVGGSSKRKRGGPEVENDSTVEADSNKKTTARSRGKGIPVTTSREMKVISESSGSLQPGTIFFSEAPLRALKIQQTRSLRD